MEIYKRMGGTYCQKPKINALIMPEEGKRQNEEEVIVEEMK